MRSDFCSSIETTVLREECNHARARLREQDPNIIFKTAGGKTYEKVKQPAKRQRNMSSTSSISSNENDGPAQASVTITPATITPVNKRKF